MKLKGKPADNNFQMRKHPSLATKSLDASKGIKNYFKTVKTPELFSINKNNISSKTKKRNWGSCSEEDVTVSRRPSINTESLDTWTHKKVFQRNKIFESVKENISETNQKNWDSSSEEDVRVSRNPSINAKLLDTSIPMNIFKSNEIVESKNKNVYKTKQRNWDSSSDDNVAVSRNPSINAKFLGTSIPMNIFKSNEIVESKNKNVHKTKQRNWDSSSEENVAVSRNPSINAKLLDTSIPMNIFKSNKIVESKNKNVYKNKQRNWDSSSEENMAVSRNPSTNAKSLGKSIPMNIFKSNEIVKSNNKNVYKTKQRNWDSSSEENVISTIPTKETEIDKSYKYKNSNFIEILEQLKKSRHNKNEPIIKVNSNIHRKNNDLPKRSFENLKCFPGSLSKILYREQNQKIKNFNRFKNTKKDINDVFQNFHGCSKHHTKAIIRSMPITEMERKSIEKKKIFSDFIIKNPETKLKNFFSKKESCEENLHQHPKHASFPITKKEKRRLRRTKKLKKLIERMTPKNKCGNILTLNTSENSSDSSTDSSDEFFPSKLKDTTLRKKNSDCSKTEQSQKSSQKEKCRGLKNKNLNASHIINTRCDPSEKDKTYLTTNNSDKTNILFHASKTESQFTTEPTTPQTIINKDILGNISISNNTHTQNINTNICLDSKSKIMDSSKTNLIKHTAIQQDHNFSTNNNLLTVEPENVNINFKKDNIIWRSFASEETYIPENYLKDNDILPEERNDDNLNSTVASDQKHDTNHLSDSKNDSDMTKNPENNLTSKNNDNISNTLSNTPYSDNLYFPSKDLNTSNLSQTYNSSKMFKKSETFKFESQKSLVRESPELLSVKSREIGENVGGENIFSKENHSSFKVAEIGSLNNGNLDLDFNRTSFIPDSTKNDTEEESFLFVLSNFKPRIPESLQLSQNNNFNYVEKSENHTFNNSKTDTKKINEIHQQNNDKLKSGDRTKNSTHNSNNNNSQNTVTSNRNSTKQNIERNAAEVLLEDENINSILAEEYQKFVRREALKNPLGSTSEYESLIKLNKNGEGCMESHKRICQIKRYRRGAIKVYRLRKLKAPSVPIAELQEDLDFGKIISQFSKNFVEPGSHLPRTTSGNSISTTSSYSTDDSKSETFSTGSQELNLGQQKLRCSLNILLKDKTLLCNDKNRTISSCDTNEIKTKIQSIFLQVHDDLIHGRNCVLKYRKHCLENCIFQDGRLQLKTDVKETSQINSSHKKGKEKLKLILFILKKVQTLLETNTKVTKSAIEVQCPKSDAVIEQVDQENPVKFKPIQLRELYYQMKDLVKNQSVIDKSINIVSCLLDIGMWSLNIVAQKGLVYGDLKILLSSGETINCKIPGTLIPPDIEEIIELQTRAYFILVVEKESVFYKLIEEHLLSKLTRPFIMITGKGFPDLNTLLFVRKLWVVMSIPVFILVDADPDGVKIMLNYRFGSVANAHLSHHLALPSAKWLGVYPSELKSLNTTTQPLTRRDLKLAQSLLRTPYMSAHPRIASEINVMLENGFKGGIEVMIKTPTFLSEVYLPKKFCLDKFI